MSKQQNKGTKMVLQLRLSDDQQEHLEKVCKKKKVYVDKYVELILQAHLDESMASKQSKELVEQL